MRLVKMKKYGTILAQVDEGRHEEALAAMDLLPLNLQRRGRMIIARGDAHYELGQDIEALKAYADYLRSFPSGAARGFALFSAAMCLKNLDMQPEAGLLLEKIAPAHPDLEKELQHSRQILEKQQLAREILAGM